MQVLRERFSDVSLSRKVSTKKPFSGCGTRFSAAMTSLLDRAVASCTRGCCSPTAMMGRRKSRPNVGGCFRFGEDQGSARDEL